MHHSHSGQIGCCKVLHGAHLVALLSVLAPVPLQVMLPSCLWLAEPRLSCRVLSRVLSALVPAQLLHRIVQYGELLVPDRTTGAEACEGVAWSRLQWKQSAAIGHLL